MKSLLLYSLLASAQPVALAQAPVEVQAAARKSWDAAVNTASSTK